MTRNAVPVLDTVHEGLVRHGLVPAFATPCGVLAPLLERLELDPEADYRVVAREDNAVGLASGVALAGGRPTVLMQNSGLGLSVNALASLVVPYRLAMLLIVSLRGTDADTTAENLGMGRATSGILTTLGLQHATLSADGAADQLDVAAHHVGVLHEPYGLLVPPGLFGWRP